MLPDASSQLLSDACRKFLRLQLADDVGPVRLRALLDVFGSVDRVLEASMTELRRADGVGEKVAASIFEARRSTAADETIARAEACGVRIVCWADADYPRLLLQTPDPPICLFLKGHIEPTDAVAVAIVGTRRCSHYGREQAIRFGRALGGAGFTVVSGLARGVDGHAHRGALEAGGRTIAVLGQGLGSDIYPPEHQSLADEIARHGAVVTELPIDTTPDAKNFPRRNRIIVGLSLGVIVVEAGERSGALISARLANEYNREVFALPGRIDCPDVSAGSNQLIRDGKAKLIMSLDDVLDELQDVGQIMRSVGQPSQSCEGESKPGEAPATHASGPEFATSGSVSPIVSKLLTHERCVYDEVVRGAEEADAICAATALDAGKVMSTLTSLQLKGLIRRLPGDRFVKR